MAAQAGVYLGAASTGRAEIAFNGSISCPGSCRAVTQRGRACMLRNFAPLARGRDVELGWKVMAGADDLVESGSLCAFCLAALVVVFFLRSPFKSRTVTQRVDRPHGHAKSNHVPRRTNRILRIMSLAF